MALKWLNPFNRVADIVSEAVTDKDKKNEINAAMEELKQLVYITELNTKTIPIIDAVHKLGRQIIALAVVAAAAWLLDRHPDMDLIKILGVLGGGSLPATAYTLIKGKGR